MTSYGHTPPDIDYKKRPLLIDVQSDYQDDYLQNTVNQFFYRSQAIANYVNELIKLDKNSLLVLVSDHLPPLANGIQAYKRLHYLNNMENDIYLNRLMIIENGKPVVYKNMSHYDLADLVYNFISNKNHCRKEYCAFINGNSSKERSSYSEKYYRLMAHATE